MHRKSTIEALLVEDSLKDSRGAYVEELRGRVRAANVTMDRARKRSLRAGLRRNCAISTNAAAAEKQIAEPTLAELPDLEVLSRDQLVTYVDELGDIGEALNAADRRSWRSCASR